MTVAELIAQLQLIPSDVPVGTMNDTMDGSAEWFEATVVDLRPEYHRYDRTLQTWTGTGRRVVVIE